MYVGTYLIYIDRRLFDMTTADRQPDNPHNLTHKLLSGSKARSKNVLLRAEKKGVNLSEQRRLLLTDLLFP